MQPNLAPPEAEKTGHPAPLGSPFKAVLAGLVVDLGGTLLVSALLVLCYAVSLARSGLSESEIQSALQDIPLDSWVSVTGTVLGAGVSVLGGFVCARISRSNNYRLGLILAAILAIVGFALAYARYPIWASVLLAAVTFFSVLAGVKLAHAKREL